MLVDFEVQICTQRTAEDDTSVLSHGFLFCFVTTQLISMEQRQWPKIMRNFRLAFRCAGKAKIIGAVETHIEV